MNKELRYKQFAPLFVVIALFYVVMMFLPYDVVIDEGQPRWWVQIANAMMSPYVFASVALGVVGLLFCLRAKREKRPTGGLIVASIGYASGALFFLGLLAWWLISGILSTIFRTS